MVSPVSSLSTSSRWRRPVKDERFELDFVLPSTHELSHELSPAFELEKNWAGGYWGV